MGCLPGEEEHAECPVLLLCKCPGFCRGASPRIASRHGMPPYLLRSTSGGTYWLTLRSIHEGLFRPHVFATLYPVYSEERGDSLQWMALIACMVASGMVSSTTCASATPVIVIVNHTTASSPREWWMLAGDPDTNCTNVCYII